VRPNACDHRLCVSAHAYMYRIPAIISTRKDHVPKCTSSKWKINTKDLKESVMFTVFLQCQEHRSLGEAEYADTHLRPQGQLLCALRTI